MAALTREDLHALVWKEPLRHLGPRLGISDTWFKKTCRAADIPLPDQAARGQTAADPALAASPARGAR